jgi:cyclophilin family peptidyl-prolyl cis-trans isomerase
MRLALACAAAALLAGPAETAAGQKNSALTRVPPPAPVLVVETVKGTIEIATFPMEAPKTVAHVVALARRNFYNGLRVHRVEEDFVVQFGDPLTRDMSKRALWGTGGSGRAIGVSEVNPGRRHRRGSVGIAWGGNPRLADSQMYITLGPASHLDADFTIFGRVTSGLDVAERLEVTDVIRRVTVK